MKITRVKRAILSGACAMAAPLVAGAAVAPVGSPIVVQPTTITYLGGPSFGGQAYVVSRGPSGAFAAAWLESPAAAGDLLHIASYDSNGNPVSTEVTIDVVYAMAPPSISINSAGQFVVTWMMTDSAPGTSNVMLYAEAFDSDGTPLSEPVLVSTLAPPDDAGYTYHENDYYGGAVSLSDSGSYVVSWDHDVMSHSFTGLNCGGVPAFGCKEDQIFQYSTYAQVFSVAGAAQTAPLTIYQSPQLTSVFGENAKKPASSYHVRNLPSTTIDADGSFSIAYDGVSNSDKTISLARLNADGSLQWQTAIASIGFYYASSGALLATNAAGQAVVGWGSYKSTVQGYQKTFFHLQRINANGSKNGFASSLAAANIGGGNFTGPLSAYLPALAMDAGGNYEIGWMSLGSDSTTGVSYLNACVQAYSAKGTTNGAPAIFPSNAGMEYMAIDNSLRPVVLTETSTPYVSGQQQLFGLDAQLYTGP